MKGGGGGSEWSSVGRRDVEEIRVGDLSFSRLVDCGRLHQPTTTCQLPSVRHFILQVPTPANIHAPPRTSNLRA